MISYPFLYKHDEQIQIENDGQYIVYPYKSLCKLGEGTYGKVFKAINVDTNEIVAVKHINVSDEELSEGIQSTTLREMSVLSKLKGHPNIVQLKDIILASNYQQYFVMEFLSFDLKYAIDKRLLYDQNAGTINRYQVKRILFQILKGVYALHSRMIFHRDLKPGNILLDESGSVKLADFGLAKPLGHPIDRTHTKEVQTLWYRAPELLLGNQKYSPALDIFSLGCIFAEMVTGQPLFSGNSEIQQIFNIFQYMGSPEDRVEKQMNITPMKHKQQYSLPTILEPSQNEWVGFTSLPFYSTKLPRFKGTYQNAIYDLEPVSSEIGVHLMHQMLQLDPTKRITAKSAMKHEYFDDLRNEDRL